MKKVILAISLLSAMIACKKKSSDNQDPAPIVIENPKPTSCQAKVITESQGNTILSLVKVTYNNDLPATIKVDSSGEEKINLVLDEKGSVKSGTIPIPIGGTSYKVAFTSTNTFNNNGLLVKSVQVSNLPIATATITNNYSYDNNSNLTLLLRTTVVEGFVQRNTKDSIVYSGYLLGRPSNVLNYSKDVAAESPYELSVTKNYMYDDKMNRIKVTENGILTEETVFSSELYPAKVGYLMDLDGNPNYGNKDQDKNFIQSQKTYKSCSGGPVYDVSKVTEFRKSGSCISNVSLADTTAVCGAAGTPSTKSYVIEY